MSTAPNVGSHAGDPAGNPAGRVVATPVVHETELEVRYAETDQMGIVHHRNYLVWFELARTGLCARSGYPYHEVEKLGYLLVVTRTETRYTRPARYGDVVRVRCRVERMQSRGLQFTYEVLRAEATSLELLATGATDHIWVDAEHRRPCRTPPVLVEGFRRLAGLDRPADDRGSAISTSRNEARGETRALAAR